MTRIALYDDLDRVEIHNELDPTKMPFPGGNNNWHDSYYFAFPFNISKTELKVMRGGQRWFDRLPDDYLPGARRDSVSTQHLIGLTDGKSSAALAHRQAFHWVYPGFIATKVRPQGAPADFPAIYSGKFPLPEATLYSRAVRLGNQADTHDLGIINVPTVEPGRDDLMIFDYAIAGGGALIRSAMADGIRFQRTAPCSIRRCRSPDSLTHILLRRSTECRHRHGESSE